MSSAPVARVTPLLAKGILRLAIGVAGLLVGVRLLGVLVQIGIDGRWKAHPNVAAVLGWTMLGAAAAGTVALITGVKRRRAEPAREAGAGGVDPDPADELELAEPAEETTPRPPVWRRVLTTTLALLCAPVVAVLVTWPGAAHLSERFIGDTDVKYNAWLGWRMAEAWRDGTWFPTRFGDALYPIGVNLWLIDGLLPTWVTGGWNLLTGDPILAYNLAVLTGVVANFLAAHHLASALTDRRIVRVIGAAAFATAPALTGAIDAHITFVYAFTLPLLLREAIVTARGDRPLRPAKLALLLVAAFLCSAYHLIFGGALFLIVVLCWPRSSSRTRNGLVRLGIGFAGAAIVLSPFIVHRLDFAARERDGGAPGAEVADAITYSNDALGTVSRPDDETVRLALPGTDAQPPFAPLRPAFVGLLLLGGVALGCGFAHSARRPLLIAGGVLWLLGLGPTLLWDGEAVVRIGGEGFSWLPYRLLLEAPGLGTLRAPYRTNFALAAAACALFVIGVDQVASRLRRPTSAALAGLVIVALFAVSLSIPVEHSGYDLTRPTRRGLERIASSPDSAGSVITVPFECRDDNRLVLWQTIHRHPTIGCSTVPAAIPWYSGMQAWVDSPELAALRCDPSRLAVRKTRFSDAVRLDRAGVRRLHRELGVRYLIYERVSALAPGCGPVRERVAMLARRAKVLSDDGRIQILDLGPSPGREA